MAHMLGRTARSCATQRAASRVNQSWFSIQARSASNSHACRNGSKSQQVAGAGSTADGGAWVLARGFAVEFSKRLHIEAIRLDSAASPEPTGSQQANQDARRRILNRLLYRSRQRGYLELDLLLGKWAEKNVETLDDKTTAALVQLLDEENPDLWKWLTGQAEAPPEMAANPVFISVHKEVAESLEVHSDPQTRASPGAPWVRGWDDRDKKQRWSPPAGNQ